MSLYLRTVLGIEAKAVSINNVPVARDVTLKKVKK